MSALNDNTACFDKELSFGTLERDQSKLGLMRQAQNNDTRLESRSNKKQTKLETYQSNVFVRSTSEV